jgi:hypothetical protein
MGGPPVPAAQLVPGDALAAADVIANEPHAVVFQEPATVIRSSPRTVTPVWIDEAAVYSQYWYTTSFRTPGIAAGL